MEELTSGETFKNILGKIAKAISELINHIALKASSSSAGHIKISSSSAITEAGEFALDAVEKNASINGTMANQIGKKVNTSDIVNNLTSTATNKPLSAAQGTTLKAIIDTLNNKTGNTGQALKMNGYANKNLVYSNYDFGIYYVAGDEEGLPIKGYSGFMITIKFLNSRIVKILFLINTYTYVLGQDNDGTVLGGWTRLNN